VCVTGPHHHDGGAAAGAAAGSHDTGGAAHEGVGPSRRRFLGAAATAVVAGALGPLPSGRAASAEGAAATSAAGIVDLTYPFTERFPTFPAFTPAQRRRPYRVQTNKFYAQQWELWEHQGTHLDAPAHFVAGGRMVTQIGLDELVGLPVAVVDITERAGRDPDTAVTPADLETYEKTYGRIPDGAAVLMNSGWEKRLATLGAFNNAGADGRMHFPGFGADAVDWLLAQRNVRGLGVDTLSLDVGRSLEDFPAHVKWLGADRWAMECLASVGKLPPRGARLVAAVIPYEEGSGGQVRAFATLG